MKTIHKFNLQCRRFIIGGLLMSACLLALLRGQNVPALPSNVAHGAAAIEQLKKDGSYTSLATALNAARYQVQTEDQTWRAENPVQQLSAHFTPAQVRIAETAAVKPQWQFGMKLSGYGYGNELTPVSEGNISSDGNRVEIRKGAITEWYVNQPQGLEQGFTLSAPPQAASRKPPAAIKLALQLTGDLRAVSTNNQAITLQDNQGRTVLSYDHLAAWDANHKTLPATMRGSGNEITLEVDDTNAVYPVTIDPLIGQQAKLVAADGTANDKFGNAVAVSGDTALIGAEADDASRGAVYVFVRSGSAWTQQAKLNAVDGVAADRFGISVALDGNTAVIGASGGDFEGNVNHGAAYVFTRSGASWSQQTKLAVSDGAQVNGFGYAVALGSDTALIGTPFYGLGSETSRGAVYVYTRSSAVWTVQQKLLAGDGAVSDNFGGAVALSGDTALIGAGSAKIGAASAQGAAYVFTRSGAAWSQQAKLVANDGVADDQFGWSVGLSGNTAIVGARLDDVNNNSNQGSAYVFVRNGTAWSQQQRLNNLDGGLADAFGVSVSVSGDLIAVGADDYDLVGNQNQGAVYIFARNGATWSQQQKLRAADGAPGDYLGKAVALSGNTLVSGAYKADVNGNQDQGAAYVFTVCSDLAQQQTLTAADPTGKAFGARIAISGDTAVIGAPLDTINNNTVQGSAYIFVRNGATWVQQQKLTASNGAASDQFGYAVAISGNTVVIGAPYHVVVAGKIDQGSAYVYVRNGAAWSQQAVLTANDGAQGDFFGFTVSISGDTAVIGAPGDVINGIVQQGSAYAFVRNGVTWTQQQKLIASDGQFEDTFGYAVALSGDTVMIGAVGDDINNKVNQGSAYAFVRSGGTWTQQQHLTSTDGAASDLFGFTVALSGETAVIGASNKSAAYVFTRNGATWSQQQQLLAADGTATDGFGGAVAINGNRIAVGAPNATIGNQATQGAAYVFVSNGTSWSQYQKLTAADGVANDNFGFGVGLASDAVLVGAHLAKVNGVMNAGKVYVFYCLSCPAISLTPATLPGGMVATSYNQQLTAGGGVGPYQYSLSSGSLPPGMTLAPSGLLSGTPTQPGTYNFTIAATASNLCNGSQSYTVAIAPNCQPFTITPAALPNGTVGMGGYNQPLSAQGGVAPYTFSLKPGDALPPGIALVNGALTGAPSQAGSFNFTIIAADAQGCLGQRLYTFTAVCQQINVFPASLSGMTVGAPFNQGISASGSDGPYTYSVMSGALPNGLTLSSAGLLSGTPTTSGGNSFTVKVTDVYGCFTTKAYSYTVACPALTVNPASLPNGTTSTSYNQTITASGGVGPYSYSVTAGVLPTGLALAANGALTGTPTQTGAATFSITATDANGCTGQKSYQMTVACSAITVGPASLPNGTTGTAYNQQLTHSGGVGNVTFSVTAGSLPVGLNLSPSGLISGMPSQAGLVNFTVTATDTNNCLGTKQYALTIIAGCPTITVNPATLPTVFLNTPYSQQLTANGGSAPYAYSVVGSLPSGLTLSAAGLLAGTVTVGAGQFGAQIKATDANGCTVTQIFGLTIQGCPTITLSPNGLPAGSVNTAYNQTITANGGVAPYTYTVSSGALPTGLTLTSAGALTGTPTASGQSFFNIKATAASGCAGTLAYALTISSNCPTITVNPATLPNGQAGTSYSQQLSASGGTAPYTFALAAGSSLPNGLTLSGAGLLSGTPTVFGSFNFTVQATATGGCTGTRAYTLTITAPCAAITVNPSSLPNGTVGTAYNQTATATGGTGPYTFTVSAGTLPNGLSLASSGALTGTPNATGLFNFTVKATDASGCMGTRAYSVTINSNVVNNGLQFYPLPKPLRLLDTRPGQLGCDAPGAQIPGGTSRTQLARRTCNNITIPANARAITGNITTVDSGGGYLTLYPSDVAQPLVANSNYAPNEILNNVFTVGLGNADGSFKIFVTSDTHVVVDVTGYYAPPAAGGLYFHPLPKPIRLLETRAGSNGAFTPGLPLAANTDTLQAGTVTYDGVTIPATALALVGNATVVNNGAGYLTLYPGGVPRPLAASSNFAAGQVMNAPFTVGLSATGQFNIYTTATTDLVIDVLGYYSADATDANGVGLLFNPLAAPVRLLETRAGLTGCYTPSAALLPASIRNQQARGVCGGATIANNALAIVGNATVVNNQAGYLTFWPNGAAQPLVATSNFDTGQVLNRHFTVGLGATGMFNIFTTAQTDLVIDVSGFFAP
jgi:hypothetical protein